MIVNSIMYEDLLVGQKLAYEPSGFILKNFIQDVESQEYSACDFEMNEHRIKFRVAKITPKKVGQFVTFWKRSEKGPIIPYDVSDSFDFLVVSVRNKGQLGQFVFPKNVLYEKGFISKEGNGGKRAMRVYALWDLTDNQHAQKTQLWQRKYFFEIQPTCDSVILKKLLF